MNFYDKYALHGVLLDNGFLSPPTLILDANNESSSVSYPAIIKPRTGSGSKDTSVLRKREDLSVILASIRYDCRNLNNFILQKYIEGPEYTVDFFAGSGEVINCIARRRLKHEGVSLQGEIVFEKDIMDVICRFCKIFNIDGLNNIQLIRNNDELFITDVNFRPSGTIVFSVRAGVDLFKNVMERRLGITPTRFVDQKPLKMIRYLKEYYYE